MARGQSELDRFVYYMVLFGGAYAIYRLALAGKLGGQLQQSAQTLHDVLAGPPQGTGTQIIIGGGSSGTGGSMSPALMQLIAINPNFVQQAIEWRQARCRNGEPPNDWAAFRIHLMRIGAPDPGPNPPPEWPSRFGGPNPC